MFREGAQWFCGRTNKKKILNFAEFLNLKSLFPIYFREEKTRYLVTDKKKLEEFKVQQSSKFKLSQNFCLIKRICAMFYIYGLEPQGEVIAT